MMRFILSILFTLLTMNTAFGETLQYQWTVNDIHRFKTQSVDDIAISGMGVNLNMQFTLDSIFGIQVESVQPNGTAQGVVFIEQFTVRNKAGTVISTIQELPKDALVVPVKIDNKGNFAFQETIQIVVDDKGNSMLVSATVNADGGSASAQTGGEKMTMHAKFDPKTGSLDADYSVEKIKMSKQSVQVKEDSSKIDLLPTQFLEMLKLPEGDIGGETAFSTSVANMTIATNTSSITNGVVNLHTSLKTGDGNGTSGGNAGDGIGDLSNMGGMGDMMGMGDMSGMGMGDIAGMENTPSMALNGEFDSTFNVNEGMLDNIDGFVSTEMSMNGMMSIKTKTTLLLEAL